MKVRSIKLSGMTSLKNQEITLSPSMTVITGVNGSGKSTILRSISDTLRAASAEVEYKIIYSKNNIDDEPVMIDITLDLELQGVAAGPGPVQLGNMHADQDGKRKAKSHFNLSHEMHIVYGDINSGSKNILIKDKESNIYNQNILKTEALIDLWSFKAERNGNPQICYISSERGRNTISGPEIKNNRNYRSEETSERFEKIRSLIDLIYNIEGHVERSLNARLGKFFPDIATVSKTRSRLGTNQRVADLVTFGQSHELGTSAAGSIEILFLVAETCTLKSSIIMIDEPELHLHPQVQDLLASYLEFLTTPEGGSNQVIIATHSLSLIYGCRSGTILFLQRDPAHKHKLSDAIEICKCGKPSGGYRVALDTLGYSRTSIKNASEFYEEYKRETPNFSGRSGLWDID